MKKIFASACCSLVLAACGLADSATAQYADIKATFVLKGNAPAAKPAAPNGAFCGTLTIQNESLLVNKDNNGIQNVVLYPDPKSFDASKADASVKPIVATPVLDNKNCRFEPHLLVIKTGQELEIKNSDPEGHNANFAFINNEPSNKQIPSKGAMKMKIAQSEPAPIPVSCGSHSWMQAHIIVQDHPFVGVSNAKGELQLKGLPAGKIKLKIWQEAAKFKEIKVAGKALPISRGAFEIELKPGMNDLGTIELEAAIFKP